MTQNEDFIKYILPVNLTFYLFFKHNFVFFGLSSAINFLYLLSYNQHRTSSDNSNRHVHHLIHADNGDENRLAFSSTMSADNSSKCVDDNLKYMMNDSDINAKIDNLLSCDEDSIVDFIKKQCLLLIKASQNLYAINVKNPDLLLVDFDFHSVIQEHFNSEIYNIGSIHSILFKKNFEEISKYFYYIGRFNQNHAWVVNNQNQLLNTVLRLRNLFLILPQVIFNPYVKNVYEIAQSLCIQAHLSTKFFLTHSDENLFFATKNIAFWIEDGSHHINQFSAEFLLNIIDILNNSNISNPEMAHRKLFVLLSERYIISTIDDHKILLKIFKFINDIFDFLHYISSNLDCAEYSAICRVIFEQNFSLSDFITVSDFTYLYLNTEMCHKNKNEVLNVDSISKISTSTKETNTFESVYDGLIDEFNNNAKSSITNKQCMPSVMHIADLPMADFHTKSINLQSVTEAFIKCKVDDIIAYNMNPMQDTTQERSIISQYSNTFSLQKAEQMQIDIQNTTWKDFIKKYSDISKNFTINIEKITPYDVFLLKSNKVAFYFNALYGHSDGLIKKYNKNFTAFLPKNILLFNSQDVYSKYFEYLSGTCIENEEKFIEFQKFNNALKVLECINIPGIDTQNFQLFLNVDLRMSISDFIEIFYQHFNQNNDNFFTQNTELDIQKFNPNMFFSATIDRLYVSSHKIAFVCFDFHKSIEVDYIITLIFFCNISSILSTLQNSTCNDADLINQTYSNKHFLFELIVVDFKNEKHKIHSQNFEKIAVSGLKYMYNILSNLCFEEEIL